MKAIITCLICTSCIHFSLAQNTRLTLENAFEEVFVRSPKISPDGNYLLFMTRKTKFSDNEYEYSYWLMDLKNKSKKQVTINGRSVNWSKDGQHFTYLKNDEKGFAQVFKLGINDAPEKSIQVTHADRSIDYYQYSPDNKRILYTAEKPKKIKAGIEKYITAFEVKNNSYLSTEEPSPTQLWICDSNGENPEKLTAGESTLSWIGGNPVWSPDGNKIAFISQASPYQADLLTRVLKYVNVETKETVDLDDSGILMLPTFTKDNLNIVYLKTNDGRFNSPTKLYKTDLKGAKTESPIWDLDRDVHEELAVYPDGSILAAAADETSASFWKGKTNGSFEKLPIGKLVPTTTDHSISHKGELYFSAKSDQLPEEIYYLKDENSKPERLTNFNTYFENLNLGKTETLTWLTQDNFETNGVLLYPPNFDKEKTYPALIYLHNKYASTEAFSSFVKMIAANDYIVFMPNYRGSYNLGESFQKSVIDDAMEGPTLDVIKGLESIQDEGFIDPNNISIYGHGYGGLVALGLAAKYDKWSSVIVHNPITDWLDLLTLSHLNSNYQMPNIASPWTDKKVLANYQNQSPLYHAHNIKAKTLIFATDVPYYPLTNSYKLFRCLQDNNIESTFFIYGGGGYYPSGPVDRMDYNKKIVEWIR